MFISNTYITDNSSPARILSFTDVDVVMLCFVLMRHPSPINQSRSQYQFWPQSCIWLL